ncbi:MAG TPA: YibE/F family protein, partial [Candidatus Sulfotelmatobacter sp.]|nr:YibE/F family protein [Candidatus Sulfotelmatobacter sp.]
NTLVLAYAGTSLIIFIFIVLNPMHVPYWVIINNELLSDEIIRTLAGSAGLVLVVPIVTAIAAFVCNKEWKNLFK